MSRKVRADARVRVHESRYGRELLVDDTFASFYEPGRVATGSVWDAIAAPILALPERRRRRVLILGLGGGSAARIVRTIAPACEIVGIERDPEVVEAARRNFDLDALALEVQVADAGEWLRTERRRFDVVMEDVFVGAGDAVHKPPWMLHTGLDAACRRVAPGGLMVSNSLDEAPEVARLLEGHFPRLLELRIEDFDNRVWVAGGKELSARALRSEVGRSEVLAGTLPRMSFRTRPAPKRRR